MDLLQLDQELRSNKIRSCYWIYGPEQFLVASARRNILKVVLKDSKERPDLYEAGKIGFEQIAHSLRTPSMFHTIRVVVVEQANKLKANEIALLAELFAKPITGVCLVLVSETLGATIQKKLPSSVAIIECKKLYPRQIPSWIGAEVRSLGLSVSREAAQFLVDCVGDDLGRLHQTLQQLAMYVGTRKLIELEDVEQVASRSAQRSIFDLTNAIGAKQSAPATGFLKQILNQGEQPLIVLAMIVRHIRLLAIAQELMAKEGISDGPVFAKKLGVHPFFAKDYSRQARAWPAKNWPKTFALLLDTDFALKSSHLPAPMILEKTVSDLCKN